MKKNIFVILAAFCILLASCSSEKRATLYPKMYEEQPAVLLVMPPINNTTNVPAKELLYVSISVPLIKNGYYVIPPHLAMELFKTESAYDAEMFYDGDQNVFNKYFGADAVVYTIIEKWQKQGIGIDTKVRYIIKSTRTNEVLFERSCDAYLDLTQSTKDSNFLTDLIVGAINTATTDQIAAARKSNYYIFYDLPRGKYHPDYMADQENPVDAKDVKKTFR